MSLTVLAHTISTRRPALISTDVFDTLVLRDHTIESERLAIASRRAATRLGLDPDALTGFRWSLQSSAYRSVAIEGAGGEVSLTAICRVAARAFGLDEQAADLLRRTEVDVEIEHLRPNRPLVDLLEQASRSGRRVVALSDTYLGRADVGRLLSAVVGSSCIAEIYTSCDLGTTKHSGGAFAAVAEREGMHPSLILHVGDNHRVDVQMAGRAAWTALHLPAGRRQRLTKAIGKALALPLKLRSAR